MSQDSKKYGSEMNTYTLKTTISKVEMIKQRELYFYIEKNIVILPLLTLKTFTFSRF